MGAVGPLILILILRIGCPKLAKCWWGPQGFRGVALARWKVIWSSVKVGAVGPLIRLSPLRLPQLGHRPLPRPTNQVSNNLQQFICFEKQKVESLHFTFLKSQRLLERKSAHVKACESTHVKDCIYASYIVPCRMNYLFSVCQFCK